MSMDEASTSPQRLATARAWRVVLVYGVFASAWIYLSDRALALVLPDPRLLLEWGFYKGMAFVALTSALLFTLTRATYGAIERRSGDLRSAREQLERLNRLYGARRRINQAVVLSSGRQELFEGACRTLVEDGGFRMVWIAWHQPETQQLVPMAGFGEGSDYARQVKVYADDRPEGRGPSGVAFRQGRPYISQDAIADPATRPWRSKAIEQGYRSCAAFPLRTGEVVSGVLNVYAGEIGYFQDREVAMLEEVARDLAYGLDNFEREAQRLAAEEQALKERNFSQVVIESMPGILYFYNEKLQLLRWNRNFETVSGYSHEEVARMSPLEFFAPEDRALVARRIEEVFASGQASVESPFMAKDGTRTPYFLTGHRIVYEGEKCLAGVGIDISQLKQAQSELLKLNATLERKVDERTAELHTMLRRAETADRLKSAFLATMSHELRTPLNSIIGFTGVLQGGLAGPINEEQKLQLGMVRGSARHLLELINDVLDLSKIEAGELRVASEIFDLRSSLERVRSSLAPAARQKGLLLDCRIDKRLRTMVGDRRRVEQIALNLLNNAIKFTDKGSVTMEADIVEDGKNPLFAGMEGPVVRISVVDTGIGIAADQLAQLFQPFRQIDSGLDREYEGTGLGLAICHKLAGLMGGHIDVSSTLGEGSRFTFSIPLGPREAP